MSYKKRSFGEENMASGVMMLAVAKENFETTMVTMENKTRGDSLAAMVTSKQKKISWKLDSGASDHLCNDLKYMNSIEDVKSGKSFSLAEQGTSVVASKKAKLSCVSNKGVLLNITDVMYAPKLHYNLLSVKKLASFGIVVIFEKTMLF